MWAKLVLAALIVVGACQGNTGPSDRGEVRVMLAQLADSSVVVDTGGGTAPIPRSAVDSLIVTITAVEAIRAGTSDEEADDPDGFVRLGLTGLARQPIDLLSLPPNNPATPGLVIADGEIDEGAYDRIRLRFDPNTARVWLPQPITVNGTVITAGHHRLAIATGAQTGVQVGGPQFTVTEDTRTDVQLVFDPGRTFSAVRILDNSVVLTPTFRLGRIDQ